MSDTRDGCEMDMGSCLCAWDFYHPPVMVWMVWRVFSFPSSIFSFHLSVLPRVWFLLYSLIFYFTVVFVSALVSLHLLFSLRLPFLSFLSLTYFWFGISVSTLVGMEELCLIPCSLLAPSLWLAMIRSLSLSIFYLFYITGFVSVSTLLGLERFSLVLTPRFGPSLWLALIHSLLFSILTLFIICLLLYLSLHSLVEKGLVSFFLPVSVRLSGWP